MVEGRDMISTRDATEANHEQERKSPQWPSGRWSHVDNNNNNINSGPGLTPSLGKPCTLVQCTVHTVQL
jgi:hypothetical protein